MTILNFNLMPRFVGNPNQYMIETYKEFHDFVRANNGIKTCFTSVYTFNKPVTQVLIDKTFLDLDHEKKPHNAFYDMQNLAAYTQEMYQIPTYPVYTGSKGYHGYTGFRPEWYDLDTATTLIRAVQTHLVNKAKLRTADPKVVGDVRRLCRIPYTKHVSQHMHVNGRYCMPLDFTMLYEWSHEDIMRRSYVPPRPIGWYKKEDLPNISEFCVLNDIPLDSKLTGSSQGREVEYKHFSDGIITNLFTDMCIHNDLLSRNPNWVTRFYVVVFCKEVLGWGMSNIINLFESLDLIDFEMGITTYHTDYIYRRRNYRNLPSCRRRREEGICVGKKCPLWEREFKSS